MAAIRYDLISFGAMFQFILSHTVATNLLTSNDMPIIIIGIAAAAKIETRPATEYHTATAEMERPLIRVNQAIIFSLVYIFIS